MKKKVFRLRLVETGVYYLDIEAVSAEEAKEIAQDALDYDIASPIYDDFSSTGYEIDGVEPIERKNANLDPDLDGELALHRGLDN